MLGSIRMQRRHAAALEAHGLEHEPARQRVGPWTSAMRPSTLMLNKGRLSVGAARLSVHQVIRPKPAAVATADCHRAAEAAGPADEHEDAPHCRERRAEPQAR
jgi:hypothetical protein